MRTERPRPHLAALRYMSRSQSLTPGIHTSSSISVTVSAPEAGGGWSSGSLAWRYWACCYGLKSHKEKRRHIVLKFHVWNSGNSMMIQYWTMFSMSIINFTHTCTVPWQCVHFTYCVINGFFPCHHFIANIEAQNKWLQCYIIFSCLVYWSVGIC